jgi:hypothetical protein
MEIGVRNDEQLIKMATIVQRVVNNSPSGDNVMLTDEEKEQLLEELEKITPPQEDKE